MKKLLIVVNDPAFFLSHRLPIALEAQKKGFEVHICTAAGDAVQIIKSFGFEHHSAPISRSGSNPLKELWTLISLYRIFNKVNPLVIHLVTIKPVLYGGIAARLAKVHGVVVAISGLGYTFTSKELKAQILKSFISIVFKVALGSKEVRVIFQNKDDFRVLESLKVVTSKQSVIIRGSGVDLTKYKPVSETLNRFAVVCAARLLKDKGIFEYVEAASKLKKIYPEIIFQLVGSPDSGNPASVSQSDLDAWYAQGAVEILGYRSDIEVIFSESNLVVLPSYREGLPKVLVEAAACGRAIVTTDVPGCRDAIEANLTGVLVPPYSSDELAKAIEDLYLDSERRQHMGRAGRNLAEKEFDIRKIVDAHMEIYEDLAKDNS